MSDGFVIHLDDESAMRSVNAGRSLVGGVIDMNVVSDLYQRIIAKAKELLSDNLPPWEVVETGVRAAYDLYIRPLSIPNFIDNVICNALVREIKKFYETL